MMRTLRKQDIQPNMDRFDTWKRHISSFYPWYVPAKAVTHFQFVKYIISQFVHYDVCNEVIFYRNGYGEKDLNLTIDKFNLRAVWLNEILEIQSSIFAAMEFVQQDNRKKIWEKIHEDFKTSRYKF
jgi:hypothetical protein